MDHKIPWSRFKLAMQLTIRITYGYCIEDATRKRRKETYMREPYAVKAARTVLTGGMEKRAERYRALSLPTYDLRQEGIIHATLFSVARQSWYVV